jgi:hypothetical protein
MGIEGAHPSRAAVAGPWGFGEETDETLRQKEMKRQEGGYPIINFLIGQ